MSKIKAAVSTIEEFHSLSNKFGNPSRKKELLLQASKIGFGSVSEIKLYHDTLLFLLAYPENEELFQLASQSIQKLSSELSEIQRRRASFSGKLEGSGIVNTKLITSVSFDLLRRLQQLFPKNIRIDSSSASKETISKIFKLLLPSAEHETIDKKELHFLARIRQLQKGKITNEVEGLLNLFSNKKFSFAIIDHLFNSLEIYVSIVLNEKTFSRTFLRSLPYPTFFQTTELEKKIDAKSILKQKIKKEIALNKEQKLQLTDTSRLALALLMRETDPVTNANLEDVEWHDMGRGFRVALFGIIPSRRLPFDSYIGYMAFKNGIPAAYGGAWMFGDGAKVGVNIFEPLRGGESAWTFCQILRLYRQRFDVKQFVVEPYQYGKHNPEGIQSGAFWFYYRLGFRPVNGKLCLLAEEEATLIQNQKGYRTSVSILKKFTESNISLQLTEREIFFPDTEKLSFAITDEIAKKYSGDRELAEKVALSYLKKSLGMKISKWNKDEKESLERMCLLFILIPGINSWNKTEKSQLVPLLKSRGAKKEDDYIHLVKKHRHLLKMLCRI